MLEKIIQKKSLAKRLVNQRANDLNPFGFITLIETFAKEHNLKFKTFRDSELLEENLNLIYAVGKGSPNKPGLITVEYHGDTSSDEFSALIGKGVTFDTGGNNLKPTGSMEDMFMDKGGASAVFAAFQGLVESKAKINIVMGVPLVENSLSGLSYRPSDIIKSHSGLTVEVTNTDAEGRLILADTMSYL